MTSNGQYIFPRFPPLEGCNEALTISIEALYIVTHRSMMNHNLTVLSGETQSGIVSGDKETHPGIELNFEIKNDQSLILSLC